MAEEANGVSSCDHKDQKTYRDKTDSDNPDGKTFLDFEKKSDGMLNQVTPQFISIEDAEYKQMPGEDGHSNSDQTPSKSSHKKPIIP